MTFCKKCGKSTDGYDLCYLCYSGAKSKAGWVYGLESKRSDGSSKVYVGGTGRTPQKRWGEHFEEIKKPSSSTWVGRGNWAKPIGAFFSSNWRKAEKTMKSKPAWQKRKTFRKAAEKYYDED